MSARRCQRPKLAAWSSFLSGLVILWFFVGLVTNVRISLSGRIDTVPFISRRHFQRPSCTVHVAWKSPWGLSPPSLRRWSGKVFGLKSSSLAFQTCASSPQTLHSVPLELQLSLASLTMTCIYSALPLTNIDRPPLPEPKLTTENNPPEEQQNNNPPPQSSDAFPPAIQVTDCNNHWEPKVSKLPEKKIKPATIAYSLAVHHKFDHLLYWMDAMYEPQHFYMIHVDSKASLEFWEEKFPNIRVNENRYHVVYYGWTVLWTHIENFKKIMQLGEARDYFINMAGMDMPIKTKREINYFLGEHMGMSFMYEHCVWPIYRQWWGNWSWSELMYEVVQVNDNSRIRPPTIQLRWGQHYVILHRDVIEWMFKSVEVMHLLGWVVNTKSPDEMFYATMLHQSPFMKKGLVYTGNNFKYATWEECCSGSVLSEGHPCVLGVCDLPKLNILNHMWATKIDAAIDSNLVPEISKVLNERTAQEDKTKKVKRIPLFVGQILDPPEIDI